MQRDRRTWIRFGSLLLAAVALVAAPARADVRLPAVIGDGMVLQREMPVPIWGWADEGEQVQVSIQGQTKTAAAAPGSGKWMVKLDPLQVGGPYPMTVRGKNTITLQKVLVGEVWLCSGQSNMSLSVTSVNNAPQEIAAANYPHLRLISVPVKGTQTPQTDFVGHWAPCSPATVAGFSAVAYFFGRDLYQKLNIPIGLIHCSWGGSSCEAWVQRSVLESDSQYKPLLESTDQRVATWDQAKLDANYQRQLAQWKKIATAAKAAGKPVPQGPRAAQDFRIGQHRSANLYNGMLLPLIPYAIRGAIWYQGESNAGRAYQYRSLFPLMIRSWRHDWQEGDFPFYFVQLANFRKVKPAPAESDWAELREAQSMTLTLPHTGQAVIIDIGDADNIHPKNKQDVGKRLALWALAKDYCQDVIYSGPVYQGMKIDGSRLVLSFGSVGGGLVARGSSLEGFTIAGADRKFVAAEARIDGDTVVVSSPQVPAPVAVRYAWADNPVCNLYSQAGLPASGFRTDQWPGITAKNDR